LETGYKYRDPDSVPEATGYRYNQEEKPDFIYKSEETQLSTTLPNVYMYRNNNSAIEEPKQSVVDLGSNKIIRVTTHKVTKISEANRNWNENFQEILSMPQQTSEEKLNKLLSIYRISVAFENEAKFWGKKIVDELDKPNSEKSIKPIDVGGIAGGGISGDFWDLIFFNRKISYSEYFLQVG
jgi:hypothetical protein